MNECVGINDMRFLVRGSPDSILQRLHVSDMPWIQAHTIQSQIILPGSGFVCMAIEALRQTVDGDVEAIGGYELNDMELLNALVIPDTPDGIEVQFSLRVFLEHCRGFISAVPDKMRRMQQLSLLDPKQSACRRLENIEGRDWYRSLDGHAPTCGTIFQNVRSIKAAENMALAACSVPGASSFIPIQDTSGFYSDPIILETILHSAYSAVSRQEMNDSRFRIEGFARGRGGIIPERHVGKHQRADAGLDRKESSCDSPEALNALKMPRSMLQAEKLVSRFAHEIPRAKILEIGAGTGCCTAAILRGLGVNDETRSEPRLGRLDYTDISAAWFGKARERFGSLEGRINYIKLDIEEDPGNQSFENGTYDLVVACSPITVESTRDEMDVQLVFGTLPGWWLSEEPEKRLSRTASVESWKEILRRAGFEEDAFEIGDCEDRDQYLLSVIMATASFNHQPKPRRPEEVAIIIPPAPALPGVWLETLVRLISTTFGSPCAIHSADATTASARTVLYLGDYPSITLGTLTADRFKLLQARVQAAQYILWVTKCGTIDCGSPEAARVTGFLRTLGAENPRETLHQSGVEFDTATDDGMDYEFAERQGRILVPRLCDDRAMNRALATQTCDPQVVSQFFEQSNSCFRLSASRPGDIGSFTFVETPLQPLK
ncbi:hypothetical protein BO71DRAFT_428899 [Aspergillus ellipticus CBS 707.79]|uniref:PKS/mFAS DH domain-containing protein n=1 Tax=Aspergillus ellipticus CBS 707.79 TaxID=1448320 RepID=A0A319DE24_9EURO|nr:hypothetical protein BO71DRAFT_428899 [Aspergillus ellipticus CBS 707.79]